MKTCLGISALSIQREKNGAKFQLLVPQLTVSFEQTLAVVGASGCGKSTLLDMLALILRPTEAKSFVLHTAKGEEDLLTAAPSQLAYLRGRHIGYVLQSGGLLSFLTVYDNIILPGRLLGLPPKILEVRAKRLAERLDILGQLSKKPPYLSGGQRQRVAIARALIHEPELVLADEPTAAVDQNSANEICAIFKSVVQEAGSALVIVSHDQALMERMADRMVTFHVEKRGQNAVYSRLIGN